MCHRQLGIVAKFTEFSLKFAKVKESDERLPGTRVFLLCCTWCEIKHIVIVADFFEDFVHETYIRLTVDLDNVLDWWTRYIAWYHWLKCNGTHGNAVPPSLIYGSKRSRTSDCYNARERHPTIVRGPNPPLILHFNYCLIYFLAMLYDAQSFNAPNVHLFSSLNLCSSIQLLNSERRNYERHSHKMKENTATSRSQRRGLNILTQT